MKANADNKQINKMITLLTKLGITEQDCALAERYLNDKKEETIEAFSKAPAEGRYLGLLILGKDPETYKREILSYAKDSSTFVSAELRRILCSRRDWEGDVRALLNGKKASERELAVRVFLKWQEEGKDYHELLIQALENEKSEKLVRLLERELKLQGEDKSKMPLSKEELVKQLHKNGKKRSIAWAYETPFSVVHRTDGEAADEEYIQAIILCYAAQTERGIDKNAQLLAADLNASEFAVYVNELFDKWIASGAARALDEAADQLGISREELADRIVPDLGFDEKMQRTFDYGERIFKVMLTPSLDIEVYDENGKKLKNLPAPGKKDDESKAPAAYEAYKEMKKQMKAAVTSQKARLEYEKRRG